MATIIIGAIVTALISSIGARIAMYRAKLWLAENKHKVKWEIIYTIFGPDPNKPPVVAPVEPEREPWLPWRRKAKVNGFIVEPVRHSHSPSWAERNFGFSVCFVVTSVPFGAGGLLLWALTR